jgi:hypothetical protein
MGEAAIAFPFNEYEKAMAANAAEILFKASAMATQIRATLACVQAWCPPSLGHPSLDALHRRCKLSAVHL